MSDGREKTPEASDDPASATVAGNEKSSKPQDIDMGFHPIEIQGEPLSETIIRERR
jgi:hypothetical protein